MRRCKPEYITVEKITWMQIDLQLICVFAFIYQDIQSAAATLKNLKYEHRAEI